MISNVLKQLRDKNNLSQAELATELKVSRGAVGMWESGDRDPNYSMLLKIAQYFNVSTDYLLGNSNFIGNELIIPEERKEGVQLLINLPEMNYQNILGQMMAYAKICGLRW